MRKRQVRQDITQKVAVPITADGSVIPLPLPEGAGKAMEVLLRWGRPQNPGTYELGLRLLEGSGVNGTREVTIVSMLVDIRPHADVRGLDPRGVDPQGAADTEGTVRCSMDRSNSSSVARFAAGYPFFKDTTFLITNATVPLAAARAPPGTGDPSDLLIHVVVDHSVIEAFFLDAASRQTGRVYPSPSSTAVSLFARSVPAHGDSEVAAGLDDEVKVEVSVWALGASFVSEEAVLESWREAGY